MKNFLSFYLKKDFFSFLLQKNTKAYKKNQIIFFIKNKAIVIANFALKITNKLNN
jgi:hypothetical protein